VRYALLFEGMAFALAILHQIIEIRRERDAALQNEISATQEKLRISEALVRAEREHGRAVLLAEQRRARLAATAHDIQQPLASLRMAVNRLGSSDETTASQVHESFDYLDSLVSANLAETRPAETKPVEHDGHERGRSAADASPEEEFDVAIILRNVEAMFCDEARDKGLELKFITSTARVRTQPLALMRIVSNLVSNAVKYTDRGRVLVGVRRRRGGISVEIHDTGPGISEMDIDRLLRPYERASTMPGTGLGLALIRDLAGGNGMAFELKSQLGKGTSGIIHLSAKTR
jgi:signal transduction histidine kinase